MNSVKRDGSSLATDISEPTELLRWWHRHQAQMLLHETDCLRNGILQEIIAIRRRLEVSCPLQPHSGDSVCAPQLAELSRLYSSLENFCDRLQSPFAQDSLPLALQHTVRLWQEQLHLQTQFPATWSPEPLEHTQLLILLMKTLLPLLATKLPLLQATHLSLSESSQQKKLRFEAHYTALPTSVLAPHIEQAVRPLLTTFCLLTEAACDVMFQADGFFLKLEWETPPTIASDHPHAD